MLLLEKLETLEAMEFGASALQKEAMRISKIDTIRIACKRVREDNPLSGITCDLSLIFVNPDAPMEGGLVSLNTD